MGDSTIPITPGVGTPMKTSQVDTSTNHVQYVRELQADTANAPTGWTLSTTGAASVIAADALRPGVLLVNNGTAKVFINFSSTLPTTTSSQWWIDVNERWEVPSAFCRLAMSFISGSGGSGTLNYTLGTKA